MLAEHATSGTMTKSTESETRYAVYQHFLFVEVDFQCLIGDVIPSEKSEREKM